MWLLRSVASDRCGDLPLALVDGRTDQQPACTFEGPLNE